MTVKAQEFPAHEPRGKLSVALGYAISPTGAGYLIAVHDTTWFENEGHPEVTGLNHTFKIEEGSECSEQTF
ncbi:MAG: aldehyde ferredoxin oxidoreductase C-terminal domain-containing protein [Halanaerobiales bacterium]|nr:aldehyde ferredoxin oxidoreductase C-terminal domain-containing protein [Halanaerobiales bacterium]